MISVIVTKVEKRYQMSYAAIKALQVLRDLTIVNQQGNYPKAG